MNRPFLDPPNARASRSHGEWVFEDVTAAGILLFIAFGCAVFLLFGIASDRTSVSYGRRGTSIMTDAAGYNVAATFSGIVALIGLTFAACTRPRLILPMLGAATAIVAFGLTVYASGIYWWGRLQGEVYFYGTGSFLEKESRGTIHPAVGPPFFAAAALIGGIATLALIVIWLREARRGEAHLDLGP